MSRAITLDEGRNSVIEEALVFASDIKDMVARAEPGIQESLARIEEFYRLFGTQDEREDVMARCTWMRGLLANCRLEAERYEQVIRLSAPQAGYPYLLKKRETGA